jgi:hypothetical protein
MYLGLPDYYTDNSNGSITVKYADEADKRKMIMPNIINITDTVLGPKTVIKNPDKTVTRMGEQKLYEQDYVNRYTKSGQLVQTPVFAQIQSDVYNQYKGSYTKEFTAVISALDDQRPISEIIDAYKKNMGLWQESKALEEANQNLKLDSN